jgi:hypothetical protein
MKRRIVRALPLCAVVALLGCGSSPSTTTTTTTTGDAGSGASSSTGAGGSGGAGGAGGSAPVCTSVPVPTGPPFTDETLALGIDFQRHQTANFCDMPDEIGGGACVFDFDGDGDLDLYFTDRAPGPNRLYRNDGATFTDVTDASGAGTKSDSMGCLAFDFDGDGDLDLYLANAGPDQILRNDGGKFTDVTAAVGLVEDGLSASVTAGDIDGDGDLDLAVAHYVDPATCAQECPPNPEKCAPLRSLLFENQNGHFVEVGVARGITAKEPTLAILLVDFDLDGDLDLYVGNDLPAYPDRLFVNDGTGHFVDQAPKLGLAWDATGSGSYTMGVAVADYNRDGVLDLVSTNFEGLPTLLYPCHQGPVCVDSHLEGMDIDSSIPFTSWGIGLVDFDHNGWLDLFTASGLLNGKGQTAQRNQLYKNGFGGFKEYLPAPAEALSVERSSRGVVFGDLNGDGAVDVVVAANQGPPQVLFNRSSLGHYLTVDLGPGGAGAQVVVDVAGQKLLQQAVIGGSYLGSSDHRLSFGLGASCSADVTVRWLNGKTRTLTQVAADAVITISPDGG